jgi:hypothetical protein
MTFFGFNRFLCFLFPPFPETSLKSYFSKEKTEKKKAIKRCPKQAKGNGISPAG